MTYRETFNELMEALEAEHADGWPDEMPDLLLMPEIEIDFVAEKIGSQFVNRALRCRWHRGSGAYCARVAGLSDTTLRTWLNRGHDDEPNYAHFAARFDICTLPAMAHSERKLDKHEALGALIYQMQLLGVGYAPPLQAQKLETTANVKVADFRGVDVSKMDAEELLDFIKGRVE